MSASRRVLESVNRPYSAEVLDAAVQREARRGRGSSRPSPGPTTSFGEPYREAHFESVEAPMRASRRVLEPTARPYSAALLDAAVEQEARRGREGSQSSPGPTMSFAEPYREAHLESIGPRTAPSTVRASVLERLGAHLAADENFGRKLSKDAARALNGVDYLTDRERHILAGVDVRAWAALAAASDKFHVAAGKKGIAGAPSGPSKLGDYLDGFKFGGGGSAYGWGDVTTPAGPGITLASGQKVGGHVGGGGSSGAGVGSGDDGGRGGGGFGSLGNFGGYGGHGNAGDPKSPTGGTIGARPSGGVGGGSALQSTAGRYTGIGVHGDPDGGRGISGGNLPSRAVLAGSPWKALRPGAQVAEEPKDPPKTPPGGSAPGPPPQVYTWPDGSVHAEPPSAEIVEDVKYGVVLGAGVGIVVGGAVGKVPGVWAGMMVGGFAGAVLGAGVGYGRTRGWWMPADTDLTGGSGGSSGPGGPRARALQLGQSYVPADDATGTSPTGPRSQVLRSLRSSAFYFPSEDATGGTPGPRSRSGPEGSLYMPAPDDPRPGNPHSRALAAAGIMPY
jgi:hypothetical protein